MNKYRKNYISQKSALILAFIIFFQSIIPPSVQALTSGPTQPEVAGFQPIGTSNMVDLFTGDFNYNIPLLDVDGYPINISYQANPGMDQEASWVGLGWSLTPGSINRTVRGVPDEFKGDAVKKEFNIRKDQTVGVNLGLDAELFGLKGIRTSAGIFYNNRRGPGIEASADYSISIAKTMLHNSSPESFKKENTSGSSSTQTNGSLDLDLSLSFNSQTGFGVPGISARFGLSQQTNYEWVTKKELSYQEIEPTKGCLPINERILPIYTRGSYSTPATQKFSTSVSLSDFARFTNFPVSPMPMQNESFSFQGRVSGELFGLAPGTTISGYVSTQKLATNNLSRPSYGYLHLEESKKSNFSIQDYSKEKNIPYHRNKPILPVSFGTYDLFSVSGHGVSGQFRAMRNDIGVFRDPGLYNHSVSFGIGGEIGAGNLFKGGANINEGLTTTQVKKWESQNDLLDNIDFTSPNGVYESVFFKGTGQKLITDKEYFDDINQATPMRTDVKRGPTNIKTNSTYIFETDDIRTEEKGISSPLIKALNNREKRSQLFSFLTVEEADKVGLERSFISDPDDLRKDHHLGEVVITQEDGRRYVYGIPAYNRLKRDVNFNRRGFSSAASGVGHLENNGELIEYDPTEDNTIDNDQGNDHFYDSEEIPGYAHSYLLTQILSSDYVDRTGNGVSNDDLGTVINFNYTRANGNSTNDFYKWRVPYKQNMAQYSEGYHSKSIDDKASYVYGEKEMWYLESIESRTMIAKFYTSDRTDGLGTLGPNGGKDTNQKIKKLDRIELFSKSEYQNGSNTEVIPIKTVHFNYSSGETSEYSLCKKVPNQEDETLGKLNLASIHFTYEDSNRGMLNAYKFSYSEINPDYNMQAYDRWGCYRDAGNVTFTNNPNYPNPFPDPSDFPYVLQEHQAPDDTTDPDDFETETDSYVRAWNLSSIELPSGSTIDIKYESDDYAYVQDHRAGQMMFVNGFSKNIPSDDAVLPDGDLLFESNEVNRDLDPSLYLRLKLPLAIRADITLDEAIEELKKRYFENVEQLFFQSSVNLTGELATENFEPIKGYLDFDLNEIGFTDDLNRDQIYVKVNPVTIRSQEYHPIAVAALQTLRLNFPEIIYPGVGRSEGLNNQGLIKAAVGYASQVGRVISGYYKNSIKKEWGQQIDLNKTWIRLSNPNFMKEGGGCRVKEISISDGWDQPNDGASKYGQRYDYTKEVDFIGDKQITISSGVASYEPMLGNEENLLRKPLQYNPRTILTPNTTYYVEEPIGESLYPTAVVGYSEVKVENFGFYDNNDGDTTNDERNGVGHSLNQFYTAKDFPVKVKYTPISDDARIRPLGKFLQINILQKDKLGVSQGFSIVTNDMHGKPHVESIYDQNGAEISSTTYSYRVKKDANDEPTNELNNLVPTISKDGEITNEYLGLEIDTWQEMQQDETRSNSIGIKPNADGFLAIVFPAVIPTVFPTFSDFENEFSSSTTTKHIKQFGLIDKVTVVQDGSSISTFNQLYDNETGAVLLTETENEFDNPIFNFNYPAHWAYEGMALGYNNTGAVLNVEIVDGEVIADTETLDILEHGDELLIETEVGSLFAGTRTYMESLDEPGKNTIESIFFGPIGDGVYKVKVIRSGHRNQASNSIASISTLTNPLSTDGMGNAVSMNLNLDQDDNILAASAMEYDENWQAQCLRSTNVDGENSIIPFVFGINPYAYGIRGNWRPKKSYVYHTRRSGVDLADNSSNVDIKSDGTFELFSQFWNKNASDEWFTNVTDDRWVPANTITMYDTRGNELENLDAININSSAQFGYEDTRATAIASNAQKCEINYDGFEDYFFDTDFSLYGLFLTAQRFNLVQNSDLSDITSAYAHTGNYSLKVPPLDSAFEVSTLKPFAFDDCEANCMADALSNSPVCEANTITLSTSTTADFYSWTGPNGFTSSVKNPTILNATSVNAGTYTVVVNSLEVCADTSQVEVIIVSPAASASSSSPVCQGQNLELFGTGGLTYSWTGPSGFSSMEQNPTVNTSSLTPGSYTYDLQITTLEGCTATDQVTVQIDAPAGYTLAITPAGPITHSQTNTFNLTAVASPTTPTNYDWFGPSGTLLQSGTNPVLSIGPATCADHGNYTVEATDGMCILEESTFVNIVGCGVGTLQSGGDNNRSSNQSITIEHLIPASCDFGGIVAFSPKNLKYKWSDGGKGAVRTNIPPGDYTVSVYDENQIVDKKNINVARVCEMEEASNRSRSNPPSICETCLPSLHLEIDEEYFYNVWIARENSINKGGLLEDTKIEISFADAFGTITAHTVTGTPWGPIIDGWQRMAGFFTVPNGTERFKINILNDSGVDDLYIDDFRIHPKNSNMVSYVYDDLSLRLMATLDDNNYASFYEYDDEGILVRTKRETENGIVTIQEARTVLKPNN